MLDLLGGMAQAAASVANNERNLAFQRENLAYTKSQNDLTRTREDNAIQRRVADMKQSGLSPVLAAGQGASTSQPIPTQAPRSEAPNIDLRSLADFVPGIMSMVQGAKDITQTQAQTALTQAQVQKSTVDTLSAEQGILNLTSQREKLDQEIKILGQERGINYTRQQREKLALTFEQSIGKPATSQGTVGKAIEDSKTGLRQFFTGFIDGTKNVINQAVDSIKTHKPPASRAQDPTRKGSPSNIMSY